MKRQDGRCARLERARREGLLVGIRRRTPGRSAVTGFVTGLGRHWVAVAVLNDRIWLDGWTLLRLKEVLAVTIEPDPGCFEIRALKARLQWPVVEGDFSLDDFVGAATSGVAGAGDVALSYFANDMVATVQQTVPDVGRAGRVRKQSFGLDVAGRVSTRMARAT